MIAAAEVGGVGEDGVDDEGEGFVVVGDDEAHTLTPALSLREREQGVAGGDFLAACGGVLIGDGLVEFDVAGIGVNHQVAGGVDLRGL